MAVIKSLLKTKLMKFGLSFRFSNVSDDCSHYHSLGATTRAIANDVWKGPYGPEKTPAGYETGIRLQR